MDPPEDTTFVDNENNTTLRESLLRFTSRVFCSDGCGRIFFILFMISMALLLTSVALYCCYCVTFFGDRSILCLSDIAWAAKFLALFIFIILVVILFSMILAYCAMSTNRHPKRAVSMSIFIILFGLFVFGAFINVNGTSMGVLGPNGTNYRCEFHDEDVYGYEVLFLSDASPPFRSPGEGCWFSAVKSLCEGSSWFFSNSSNPFDLNGTNEAYICPLSRPEVHDFCSVRFNAFSMYAKWGFITSAVSAFLFGIVYLWARQRDRPVKCYQCFTSCGPRESDQPLVPRNSRAKSVDTFFPL
jgi:hypothetical protein